MLLLNMSPTSSGQPLTNIKGFAELLQQQAFGALNDKQAEYVGHIASSSNVLHALVDNLLDLATR